MSAIELVDLSKRYGENTVVANVNLKVEQGELVSLLGPSGSGKSTILSMIAGLEVPSGGRIMIGNRDATEVPPAKRNLGVVFQSYALFPHLTVRENIAFPLTIRNFEKGNMHEKVHQTLKMLRLEEFAQRKPHQLSGGQQQRVALARALVFNPDILLLDEPLGALDKKLREEVQLELKLLQRNLGITTIMVTHDQEEALSLSSKVVVLNSGKIQQVAPPEAAYRRPVNKFVAEFVGTANLLPGEVVHSAGEPHFRLRCGECVSLPRQAELTARKGYLLLRPEHLDVRPEAHESADGLYATITGVVYLGQTAHVHMHTRDDLPLVASIRRINPALLEGQRVKVTWSSDDAWLVPT